MNKPSILILAVLVFALYYYNTEQKNTPTAPFKLVQQQQYQDNLVGIYQSNTTQEDKELILDSTYAYTYTIRKKDKTIQLTGTWELSYQNNEQHLILHSPFANKEDAKQLLTSFEERKIKVISEGLLDIGFREVFTKINLPSTRLAFSDVK